MDQELMVGNPNTKIPLRDGMFIGAGPIKSLPKPQRGGIVPETALGENHAAPLGLKRDF
jgi:hypothetical protein